MDCGELTVTVAIPTCNGASTLRRAIEAALAQDHGALRVVVVDDASDDATAVLLEGYTGHDRLGWIRIHDRAGPAMARNLALAYCDADAIAFHAPDAAPRPHRVRSLAQRLAHAHGPDLMAVYWRQRQLGPIVGATLPAAGIGGLFRRTVFEALGGFRDPVAPDDDLRQRIAASGMCTAWADSMSVPVGFRSRQPAAGQDRSAQTAPIGLVSHSVFGPDWLQLNEDLLMAGPRFAVA